MSYRSAPCVEWPADFDCCDCKRPTDTEDPLNALIDKAQAWATEILWLLSGRRYGICEVTVRPCGKRCATEKWPTYQGWAGDRFLPSSTGTVGQWTPSLINGAWVNCNTECGDDCCSVCELDLPFGPACDITSVQIDGVDLLDVEYRIDNYRRLVRTAWKPITYGAADVVSTTGGQQYNFPGDQGGMWTSFVTGWSDNFPEWPARSSGAADMLQVAWPPGFVARGQEVTFWVPATETLTIITPERGTTIRRTPITHGNGAHDDAAGTYSGGSEGMEYTIRFDQAQSVSFESSAQGFEVRSIGYLSDGGKSECWPRCQDLSKPLGQVDTWGVTYRWGIPVPVGGQIAAGKLACELVKACKGDPDCQLPQRVTQVSRQGITMTMIDTAQDVFRNSKVGIYEVDLWLAAVNPYRLKERSTVWSPELARARRRSGRHTTWTPTT